MATAKRTLLRKLAIKMGKIKPNPQSFTLQQKDFIELLEDDIPGIAEMGSEELDAILEDTPAADAGDEEEEEKPKRGRGGRGRGRGKKADPEPEEEEEEEEEKPKRGRGRSSGGTKSRGRGRGRGKKPEEEPEEEAKDDDEEPEETPKRGRGGRGRGRGRGAGKTGGRGRGKKAEAEDEPEDDKSEAPSDNGLKAVIERLDDIGPMAAQAKNLSEANAKSLEGIKKDLGTIMAHLTWTYNETLFDEDGELYDESNGPIETLDEIDWTE
jgi:hypothetical protein